MLEASLLSCKILSARTRIIAVDRSNILEYIGQNTRCEAFKNNKRGLLQAISSVFGIDSPNDDEREKTVQNEIIPLLLHPENHDKLEKLIEILPMYEDWTASGAHRFMPLATAVHNMLRGVNIFSLGDIPKGLRRYMRYHHPFYGKPRGMFERYLSVFVPHLVVSIPQKDSYSWLDIGSAPKTDGAPTLNVLRDSLPSFFKFYGIDIAMPYYEIKDGEIVDSVYARDGEFRDETNVNGVTYWNGRKLEFSAIGDEFLPGRRYDFISICMTLHHLTMGQTYESLPFTSLHVIDSEGRDFRNDAAVLTTRSQQAVVDRLLKHLEVGGILFLDPHSYHPSTDDDVVSAMLDENNFDLFFIIQRMDENTFVVYDRTPVIFRPNWDTYRPSEEIGFVYGYHKERADFYHHNGVKKLMGLTKLDDLKRLCYLFARADLLAVRYQYWRKSVWGSIIAVVKAINDGKSLPEIFETYLRHVPEDSPDGGLKLGLLEAARVFPKIPSPK